MTGSHPTSDDSDDNVVDPAVLAERRARRAELAEQSLAGRVREAQRAAEEQRTRALELERGLELAARERDVLRSDLVAREAELRSLRQREEAERRRRHEVEVEGDADRRELEAEIAALRGRVAAAEARADELSAELARAHAHAESLAEEVERQRTAREQLEQGARDVTDLSRALESRREGLDAELAELRDRTTALADGLAREQSARVRAEEALAAERDRAGAEVTLLQAELDRRAQVHDAVHAQLRALGAEVGVLRDGLAADAEQRVATESTLVEVAATAQRLRTELTALEHRSAESEQQLAAVLEELETARGVAAAEAAARARAESALSEQRGEFDRQLASVERTVTVLRGRLAEATGELQQQIEQERAARIAAETALAQQREQMDLALAGERSRSEAALAQARAATETAVAAGRAEADALRARAESGLAEAQTALARTQAEAETAVRIERDRTEAERARAVVEQQRAQAEAERADAGEAERDRLAAELARRAALDEHVRTTLQTLRSGLDDVRAESEARAAREEAVEQLVTDLVATARALREGFDDELETVRGRFEAHAADTRRADMDAAEARLAAMREHLDSSVLRLREELSAEQEARRAAEAALTAERDRVEVAGLAAVDAAVSRDELARELDDRRNAEDGVRQALADAERELELLRREHGAQADAVAVVESLTRAARRLREEAGDPPATEDEAPNAGEQAPETGETPADGAADASVPPAESESGTETEQAPTEPAAGERPAVRAPLPVTPREGAVPMRPYVVNENGRDEEHPWIARALRRLEAEDPELALTSLLALLPVQAPGVGRDVRYDLTVRGQGTFRVVLHDGTGSVAAPTRDAGDPDVAVVGGFDALVPLAAGGAARRLPAVEVVGPRRRMRRVLKACRKPVSLVSLLRAGVAPPPRVLLTLLAGSVDPAWTADTPLTVDFLLSGEPGGTWRVQATGTGPLTVTQPDADAPEAGATLHLSTASLLPLLAALPLPPGERLLVSGDPAVARRLGSWFARAQGLPPGV